MKKILFKTPNGKKNALCTSAKKKQTPSGITNDRYIPSRVASNMEIGYHLLNTKNISDDSDRENQIDHVKKKLIKTSPWSPNFTFFDFNETKQIQSEKNFLGAFGAETMLPPPEKSKFLDI